MARPPQILLELSSGSELDPEKPTSPDRTAAPVESPAPAKESMQRTLERLQSLSAERARQRQAEETAKILQMPLPVWPESVRGVPNVALRSALFGAIKRGPRRYMDRELVTSLDGYEVRYTGPRLDQADLDVWEQCLHLARQGGVGCRIHFTAHSFLKSIHRSTGGKDVEWLKSAFSRLASAVIEAKHGKYAYFGPMIQHGGRDDETGEYCIEMNPAIVALYGPDGWSQIDWQQRQQLKRQPLAQWLHGFYSTHAQPFPLKVKTLHQLSGSENGALFDFRRQLRLALDKVSETTGWTWRIDENDLVHIVKTPTPSQAKHLARRSKKKD